MGTRARADLREAADEVLRITVAAGVPGVVAMATNRGDTIYAGAAGKADLGTGSSMTSDHVFALYSTTKAITGAVIMQQVEQGKLSLDEAAKKYVPEIAEIEVLEGFDADGEPIVRAPKSDITTRQLLAHTAGFGYDFYNRDLIEYHRKRNVPSTATGTNASLRSVLLFDPGERWEYGINIDWAGKVAEAVDGERLADIMRERILAPLGMNDTAFALNDAMRARRATIHQRRDDGSMKALSKFELPADPEQHMGGHGLYGTVGDYMKFIRMILNDGMGPHGRVLSAETVATMARNHLGDKKIKMLPSAIPKLTNDAEFFPGMPKSWGLTFMINDEDAPTGRPAGSLAWAGLANLYYWIDRKNGIGGFWATQIFPFVDPVSVAGYLNFETAVYDHIK
jgi:methyl acetate hydrolase